jgi:phage terminase Nu1 subunit (DNA packaging protein)
VIHNETDAKQTSRVIESGGSTVDARDLLGHTTTKQTDTYLRSRSKGLAQAIARKEAHEAQLAAERARLAAEAQKSSNSTGECDNPTVIDSEDSESAEVMKH